ncbi:MAG: hypothetical protein ACT4QG_11530 [Sporichthyaceae bacterium]
MRTRVLALPLVGVLLFGAGQLTGRSAAADGAPDAKDGEPATCSTSLLKGRYVFSGGGTIAGNEFDTVGNFLMDGKGTISEGFATVGLQRVAYAEELTLSRGTYSVDETCMGTLSFFAAHNNDLLGPTDHTHDTRLVVFDGGRQFSVVNLSTKTPGGPNNMSEAFRLTAHRV